MKQSLLSNRQRLISKRIFTVGVIFSLGFMHIQLTLAAAITTPRDYLNRQKADLASGVQHEIFFTEASGKTGTDNEVRIIFPDGDDGKWCRTADALTVTAIQNPTGATETATNLVGTLAATCAQGSGSGSAEANSDRILITGVGILAGSTKYGVRLADGTGVLGTAAAAGNNIKVTINTYEDASTLEDTGTLALSLISSPDDQVVVSATVDPTLTVVVGGNSANLGTLSTSVLNFVGVTSTVSTNANTGFISLVKFGATLTSSGNTIAVSDTDVDAGTSEWGASTDDASAVDLATTNTSPACDVTQRSEATARSSTALTTTFQSFASETAAATSDVTTLCFLASASATQQPGTYTSTVTLVTTAKF